MKLKNKNIVIKMKTKNQSQSGLTFHIHNPSHETMITTLKKLRSPILNKFNVEE